MKKLLLFTLIILSIFLVSCDVLDMLGIELELPGNEPVLYTIEFESNGGTAVASQQLRKNSTIKRPENPTKENFYFDGWYCEGEKWSFTSDKVDGDILLEAKWLPMLTISFSTSKGMCPAPQSVEPNGLIKEPTPPKANGYLFDGWYYQGKKWSFDTDTTKKEITLEARFLELVTITFDVKNGVIDNKSRDIVIGTEIGTLPIPARDGYIFRGWYLSADDKFYNAILPTSTFDKDTSLSARWEEDPAIVVITLDANGGALKDGILYKSARLNMPIGELPTPNAPNGGEFVGWYDENGVRYSKNIEVKEKIKLTAKYQFDEPCPVTGKTPHNWTNWYYELISASCTEDHMGIKTCKDCKLEHVMILEDAKGHTYDNSWEYGFMSQERKCITCQAVLVIDYKDITDKVDDYTVKGNIYGSENTDCLFNGDWDETSDTTFCCKDGAGVSVTINLSVPTNVDGIYIKGTGGHTYTVSVRYEGQYSLTQISTGSFNEEPSLVKLTGAPITEIVIEMKNGGYGNGYWQEIALVQIPD